MKKIFLAIIIFICIDGVAQQKPRTIITTDGEIDDVDSYIRMLLYSNEFNVEGLVYSSSMWHYKGDGKGTKFVSEMAMTKQIYGEKTDLRWPGTTWMNGLIDAYEKVYPNLIKHAKGYPTANYLRSVVKVGNIDFEGEMQKNTEGSAFIKTKLLDKTTASIYLQVWGGTNTIARALKSIEEEYKNTPQWNSIYKKVCSKAILFTILDQDATYKKYIAVQWKDIKVYYNSTQFWCLAYNWKKAVPEKLHYCLEAKFMGEQIINNHGSLTKMYYSYGDGQKQEGDNEHIHGDPTKLKNAQWGSFNIYDFISEGDSPAFLHLINVGLDNLQDPEYGGWGGRLIKSKETPSRWEDGSAAADYNPYTDTMDLAYAQTRWIETLQNDFAARANWCVADFKHANHPPLISVNKKLITAKSGQKVLINATAADPDNNSVKINFWQYKEVGTGKETVTIKQNNNQAEIILPATLKKGDTVHIIVEGKDSGSPALTRYQRVIITII